MRFDQMKSIAFQQTGTGQEADMDFTQCNASIAELFQLDSWDFSVKK